MKKSQNFTLRLCLFSLLPSKYRITIVFLLLAKVVFSQELEDRIEEVENGLTLQMTLPAEKEITRKSILQRLQESKIHGASIAVINDGKIEWSKTYGIKEVGKPDPVTTETLFQCASIGKVITSLAVLKLVEGGKIDLDEDVNNKLKRWKIEENKITKIKKVTPRHLLSHSAGLTDGYGFLGYDPNGEIPTLLQILNNEAPAKAKKSLAIKTEPGTIERYSGAGYLILQLLIEDVSGLSYEDYVQQHIFDSLGMIHSTYDHRPDEDLEMTVASGHLSNGKPLKKKKYHVYPEKGAAGPWTTAEDLAKLIIGVQKSINGDPNSILKKETTLKLLTRQINNKGLGVNLKGIEKPEAFWHAGQNLGYMGVLYGLIDERKGAVILINSDGGERIIQEFITSVAHAYDWPIMKSYTALNIPMDLQSDIAGAYESDDKAQRLSIEMNNNMLYVKSEGSKKGYQLYRIEDNRYTFKNAQDYYMLSFNFKNDQIILTYAESIGKVVELKKVK
ncbi:MAG: serine hydrolase domain-containing protein [Bacteroidota bacterium]